MTADRTHKGDGGLRGPGRGSRVGGGAGQRRGPARTPRGPTPGRFPTSARALAEESRGPPRQLRRMSLLRSARLGLRHRGAGTASDRERSQEPLLFPRARSSLTITSAPAHAFGMEATPPPKWQYGEIARPAHKHPLCYGAHFDGGSSWYRQEESGNTSSSRWGRGGPKAWPASASEGSEFDEHRGAGSAEPPKGRGRRSRRAGRRRRPRDRPPRPDLVEFGPHVDLGQGLEPMLNEIRPNFGKATAKLGPSSADVRSIPAQNMARVRQNMCGPHGGRRNGFP